jgi:CheY-like chemotaxis protein
LVEPRVLVVEDDDSIRNLLVEHLAESANASVRTARDGADALHAVRSERYDVVLLDLMMPYMSGVDFLVSLVTLSGDPSFGPLDAPNVIVITGASEIPDGELEQRFPRIVRCVHRKPLVISELAECIRDAMGEL